MQNNISINKNHSSNFKPQHNHINFTNTPNSANTVNTLNTIKNSENTINTPNTPIAKIEKKNANIFEKISFIIFIITLFFSILFIAPINYAPIDISKSLIISIGLLVSMILYSIKIFKEKKIIAHTNKITILTVLIIISSILSALFNSNFQKSIIGQGFEISTISFLAILFFTISVVMSFVLYKSNRISLIYKSLNISFIVLFIFQIIKIIYPSFLSFDIFNEPSFSLIGRWTDFGLFSSLIFILSYLNLSHNDTKGLKKVFQYILFFASFISILLVNSIVIYFTLAIVILGYGIYRFTEIIKNKNSSIIKNIISSISIPALILFILFTVLLIKNDKIITPITNSLKVNQTDLYLPWQLTLDISSDTIKNKPIFGAGPNKFINEYLLHKPSIINQGQYWATEFNSSFSFISNFVITNGIVGIILWILFYVFFFILGIKSIHNLKDNKFKILSSFFAGSFLWIMALLYSSSHTVLFITFIITGIFLSLLNSNQIIKNKELSIEKGNISRKLISIITVLAIILLVLWFIAYARKALSIAYFQSAISSLNNKDKNIDRANELLKKALKINKSDIYYQALTELNIIKINSLAQQIQAQSQNTESDKVKNKEMIDELVKLVNESIDYSRNAIKLDNSNYYNYLSEARISEIASSLQITNGYENAKIAYENALMNNPYNPSIYLSLAKLEFSKNKIDEAQKNIGNALQIKQNYIDAIFLLSQIQVNQGQIKDAITSIKVTTQINPNDYTLFFQLGMLYYNDKDYTNAIQSFNKAIELNKEYANARYFLGLSLAKQNKFAEAIIQFEEIAKTNPENQEIEQILLNLKSGKAPFAEPKNADSKPEKRKSLPIKEKNTI